MDFLLQDVDLLNCKNLQDGSQGSLVLSPSKLCRHVLCLAGCWLGHGLWVLWSHWCMVGPGAGGVGPEAGGVGPGAGMQALGFLWPLVQMPGTRGVLILCVCVCCPTLPDVGAFCCVGPPWRSFAVLPCEWDCGCPWTGWPSCLFCPAGVIEFSVFLWCLWSFSCLSVVELQCPSLTNQHTRWQT